MCQQPFTLGVVLTKSDTDAVTAPHRALYVGGAGNLNVVLAGGQTLLLTAVPVGTILPIQIKQLLSTSTTASLVVALG